MKLSFTLDEKIFTDISPEALIEKACSRGVSSLELSPDTDVLPLEQYKKIIKIVSSKDLELNYHVPYFANAIYELDQYLEYKEQVKNKYLSFLNLIESFQQDLKNKPVIVFHGINYIEQEKAKAMDGNLRFLDWILNIFAKSSLPFIISLETLRKKDIRNTLDNREDIFKILDNFKTDNLKICWDMCHDKLNFYPKETKVDDDFLSRVTYGHIHGHNTLTDTSHISLTDSDIDYSSEVRDLLQYGFKGSVNIELLSNCSKTTYLDDLFKDIEFMNRYI